MHIFTDYKIDIAVLFMRLILGILFFFQGFDKIFGLGLKRTEEGMEEALRLTKLPQGLIRATTFISSFIELIGAVLIIVGWNIYPALFLLGVDLVVVCAGMSLREPLWDMRFVMPRLLLLIALLLLPVGNDHFSIDHLLHTYEDNAISAS